MTSEDPYTDPASGVLINKVGSVNYDQLSRLEADLSYLRNEELQLEPLAGYYDLLHLCAFHRKLFGDIYPWAGQIRTCCIAKSDLFALPQFIRPYANEIFIQLRQERLLIELHRDAFLDRFTYFFSEVNAVHPFREGNGRTQRAFFRQLALQAGWRIDFADMDAKEYNEASRLSMVESTEMLRQLFAAALIEIS